MKIRKINTKLDLLDFVQTNKWDFAQLLQCKNTLFVYLKYPMSP